MAFTHTGSKLNEAYKKQYHDNIRQTAYEVALEHQKETMVYTSNEVDILYEPEPEVEPLPEYISEPSTEPTTEIVQQSDNSMELVGYFELTAYTHTGNPMANGQMPYCGAVACNSIPLGTTIYIEGYGTYVVCDTGGMGGGVIDIFMDSYDECINFGRQGANIYIVR